MAHVKWGGNWRIPTKEEWEELKENCVWEWKTEGGHKGYRVTGKNGNSIFLPATGSYIDTSLQRLGINGGYWSSTLSGSTLPYESLYAKYIYFTYLTDSNYIKIEGFSRMCGLSIRPVTE